MKKLFLSIAVLLLATVQVCAQANIAGTLYASNFAQWTVSQGNNGPYSWSSSSVCTQATSGGVTFRPFTVGTPIRIVDTATPGNTENVTVNAVNINGSGCNISTSAPAHQHYSFYLTSATAGLQEAINFSKQSMGTSNPASVVIVTPAWSTAGGTTSMITPGAQGTSAISILDERTSVIVPYTWQSTLYVAQPFNANALTSVTLTGDVTATVSGPGAGTGAATLATVLGSPGTCGDTTHSCGLTINAKGLDTALTNNLIAGPTLGTTLLPLGTSTQQVVFNIASLPTFSFLASPIGNSLTDGYIDCSANGTMFGCINIGGIGPGSTGNFMVGRDDTTGTLHDGLIGITSGAWIDALSCIEVSGSTPCSTGMRFGYNNVVFGSQIFYGSIAGTGANFSIPWALSNGSSTALTVSGSTNSATDLLMVNNSNTGGYSEFTAFNDTNASVVLGVGGSLGQTALRNNGFLGCLNNCLLQIDNFTTSGTNKHVQFVAGTNNVMLFDLQQIATSGLVSSLSLPGNAVISGDMQAATGHIGGSTSGKLICTADGTNCPASSTGLSGMTTGQVPIAATAITVTSSKALAGSGMGITTGPTSNVAGDITCFTGTAGQIADCGQIPTTLYFHVDNIPVTQNDFVGPLYLVPHAYTFTNATINSTSGTCTGIPQYSIRDLGTSIVAWGSSTQVATFSSGPNSKSAAAVSFTIAAGHYMGIGFTGGTCSVNYTSDLSLN